MIYRFDIIIYYYAHFDAARARAAYMIYEIAGGRLARQTIRAGLHKKANRLNYYDLCRIIKILYTRIRDVLYDRPG